MKRQGIILTGFLTVSLLWCSLSLAHFNSPEQNLSTNKLGCSSCHTGGDPFTPGALAFSILDSNGIKIADGGADGEYELDTEYTIQLRFDPQQPTSTNYRIGMYLQTTEGRLLNPGEGMISDSDLEFSLVKSSATPAALRSFEIRWRSPSSDIGPIRLRLARVEPNGNGNSDGGDRATNTQESILLNLVGTGDSGSDSDDDDSNNNTNKTDTNADDSATENALGSNQFQGNFESSCSLSKEANSNFWLLWVLIGLTSFLLLRRKSLST